MNVSRIEPHRKESSTTGQKYRSNAWGAAGTPDNNEMNQTTNMDSPSK
jgi:hypothetical protein